MKDLPSRPSRVAQTQAVAEKQKHLAVPYEDEKGDQREGRNRAAHFRFKTDTKFFRTVIKSKTENRNVKTQGSGVDPESFSGVMCQEPQPRSADQVFAFQPFC
jgi:hypothetical protein